MDDYSEFYLFDEADIRGAVRVYDGTSPSKWDMGLIHRCKQRYPNGITLYPAMGKRLYDVIMPLAPFPYILSERVMNLLRENNITGWESTPVRIDGQDELKYEVLMIKGRCGDFDYSKSNVIWKQFPGGLFPWIRGLYFDLDTWDGSDMFVPNGTAHLIVTKKVKQLLTKNKVKNLKFTRISEVEDDVFNLKEKKSQLNYSGSLEPKLGQFFDA